MKEKTSNWKNTQSRNDTYEKIKQELNNWPDWKKDAYNKMFALSSNSIKLK